MRHLPYAIVSLLGLNIGAHKAKDTAASWGGPNLIGPVLYSWVLMTEFCLPLQVMCGLIRCPNLEEAYRIGSIVDDLASCEIPCRRTQT